MKSCPTIYISVERKKNLGDFNSETITIGVSGLPFDADEDQINQALDTGADVVTKIREQMRNGIAKIRNEKAFESAIPDDVYVPTERDRMEVEPITDGQLVAVNAALSAWGITGPERFVAIKHITGKVFTSTKDLMRSDAHDVLEYISNATDEMREAVTGQGVLV